MLMESLPGMDYTKAKALLLKYGSVKKAMESRDVNCKPELNSKSENAVATDIGGSDRIEIKSNRKPEIRTNNETTKCYFPLRL